MSHTLQELISPSEIATTVQRLAMAIDQDYVGRSLLVIGVLKGSFIFLADMVRAMQTPIRRLELIQISSYGSSTTSSGQAQLKLGLEGDWVRGEHVLLIEDMIDTGITLSAAIAYIQTLEPASIKLCALLDKPARRQQPVTIDYLGLTIPDRFIVGYGIDYDEQYRQLPGIYWVEVVAQ